MPDEALPLWAIPLWLIFASVAAVLLAGHEAGVRLRRAASRRADHPDPVETIGGNYLSASLGLLAFLIGFSFSMAVERYNTRSALVREEANLISTAYRRLDSLDAPHRVTLTHSLAVYVDGRRAFSHAQTPNEIDAAERRSDQLQDQFWATAIRTLPPADPAGRTVLDAANAMFNVAALRRAALEAVVPHAILGALLLYAVIAATFMGYSHPVARRNFLASTVQFVLLALAFTLIIDLARTRTGLVTVSQAPLYRVADKIRDADAALTQAPAGLSTTGEPPPGPSPKP